MKKQIVILIIGFIFILQACNEDEFLREDPRDDIFAENLFVNYDGFVNGLNAVYALVRDQRDGTQTASRDELFKLGTDNVFVGNGSADIDPFNDYADFNSQNDLVDIAFTRLYEIINTTNLIINRAENDEIDWQGNNEQEDLVAKNKVVAQAKLVRAWCYRHLRYGWGPVPLSLYEITGTTYRNDWERTPVEQIQQQMEEDLLFARDNLDMVEESGTVNSAVAGTLLAELYLDMNRPDEATDEALRVINSGEYELMTTRFGINASKPGNAFSDIFDNVTRETGNREVLWVLNNAYDDVVGSAYLSMRNLWHSDYRKDSKLKKVDDLNVLFTYNGGKGAGRLSVSDSAFAWYEPFDDRYSEHAVKKYYIYPKDASATEFDTLRYTNMDYDEPDDLEDHFLWPWVRKWEYNDPYILENAGRAGQYDDQLFMRLAETYLLAAEALMKQGKNNEAATYLNELRARSNASPISASDVTLEFILKERSRELVTEEYRRHTLVRTGKFYEWAVKYNPRLDESKVQPYNEYFPIPQGIIDANTGAVMEQNSGYN
ncbi:MAG: RagB/SusD family nutrient uptake outer membrane protein [Mariniphaga sp.]|jgi:hypothetical protein|nr:RagB/SusD family nutrient uptake outer membrane protein [Mariniphaga sp.]